MLPAIVIDALRYANAGEPFPLPKVLVEKGFPEWIAIALYGNDRALASRRDYSEACSKDQAYCLFEVIGTVIIFNGYLSTEFFEVRGQ